MPLKPRDYAKLNLLLLESSGPMRSAIFYMLRDLGVVNLSVASLGPQVLELFDEHDAITGIQLLEEARFWGYIRPTAGWILMTSDSSQEVILHAMDSHPDDLITKPFSQHELEQRISSLVLLKRSLERPSVCALR